MTICLKVQGLSLQFGDYSVLNEISGEFSSTQPHLILGRSGCGKTSLLKIIAGFLPSGNGQMLMNESPWEPEGKIGLAFQNPENLFFCPTVAEEVCFALTQRGLPTSELVDKGKEILRVWGLNPEIFWDRNPLQLSGGEKRRVALAATSVFAPEVLLLDEPFAGIDTAGQDSIADIISSLAKHCIVFIVTHNPEFLLPIAGSILLIQDGLGRVFQGGQAFLKAVLKDPELYPLPKWYCDAVMGISFEKDLPWVDPASVADHLRGICREDCPT